MSKINSISGFPEWLPEQKLAERKLMQTIENIYSSFGFTPLETAAVELVSTLTSKGEINKEIYSIQRLNSEPKDTEKDNKEAQLALHFDLTVPLGRYVAQNYDTLVFPFKRYQMQKVWRGERPQEGRFREFYQFDIDIIARDELPISCDAEIVNVIAKVFSKINLGKFKIKLNNRKLLLGFYNSLGLNIEQQQAAITIADKIAKIGADGVTKELTTVVGLNSQQASEIVKLAGTRFSARQAIQALDTLKVEDSLFVQGKNEVKEIISYLSPTALDNLDLDLSIARGLDYYTGTIIETYLTDNPSFGSVCGGGRYEDLASRFIKQKLPGVGVSIGLTRLLSLAFKNNLLEAKKKTPSQLLITLYDDAQRMQCENIAEQLRELNVACEVFFKAQKLGKQIEYADKKGINYVLFIGEDNKIEVKNLLTKEQKVVENLNELAKQILAES